MPGENPPATGGVRFHGQVSQSTGDPYTGPVFTDTSYTGTITERPHRSSDAASRPPRNSRTDRQEAVSTVFRARKSLAVFYESGEPLLQVDTVIDKTEFSILTTIERSQTSLWKKEIHRRVLDSTESIPGLESLSIQTISRRVQDLYDADLLKARLTNTDAVNRTLITTYELTDSGNKALDQYRESFLKDWALTHLHSQLSESAAQPETEPTAIRHIFCDHYDIPRQACNGVAPENILKVLTDTFIQGQLDGIVEEERHAAFTTTLRQHSPDLLEGDKT